MISQPCTGVSRWDVRLFQGSLRELRVCVKTFGVLRDYMLSAEFLISILAAARFRSEDLRVTASEAPYPRMTHKNYSQRVS